jgi:hypothetical protein
MASRGHHRPLAIDVSGRRQGAVGLVQLLVVAVADTPASQLRTLDLRLALLVGDRLLCGHLRLALGRLLHLPLGLALRLTLE